MFAGQPRRFMPPPVGIEDIALGIAASYDKDYNTECKDRAYSALRYQ
jgi:hypothetical protein